MDRLWPPGAATGVGSLPGTDPVEAQRTVLGELPDLPHLVELPGRGPGAEMVGRGAALLVDLPVEVVPSGWRLAAHPGRDLRRARDLLARDLDALEQVADGWAGPLKVQVTGPWTLAASVELPTGHAVVTDPGAVRDLTESLAEGLIRQLQELSRRLPAARLVVQVDEPGLPAVLAGSVPTPSGYGTVRAVEANVVEDRLRAVLTVIGEGARVVHCCARRAPVGLFRAAGADAVSLDLAQLTAAENDALGEAVDAGMSLWLGVVPSVDSTVTLAAARDGLARLWNELGFPRGRAASDLVPTPACGLAAATPAYARRAMTLVRDVGRALRDESD